MAYTKTTWVNDVTKLNESNMNNIEDGIEQNSLDIATKYDSTDIATQLEAEEGTDNTKLMTPLRTKQALNNVGIADKYEIAERGEVEPNLDSWETRTNAEENTRGAAAGNGIYVVSSGTDMYISTNAVTWDYVETSSTDIFFSIAFGNGVFVAVGDSGRIMTSTDGISWINRSSPTIESIRGVAFDKVNGYFWATGRNDSRVYRSINNGVSWANITTNQTSNTNGIAVNGDVIVVSSDHSSGSAGRIYTSTNGGASWSTSYSLSFKLWDVIYENNIFVVVGDNGRIISSGNGTSWSENNISTSSNIYTIAYGSNHWVIVGQGPGISVSISTNLNNWEQKSTITTTSTGQIAFGDGFFVFTRGTNTHITTSGFNATYILKTDKVIPYNPLQRLFVVPNLPAEECKINVNEQGVKDINIQFEANKLYELVYTDNQFIGREIDFEHDFSELEDIIITLLLS